MGRLQVDSPLIQLFQIVANVNERRSFKSIPKVTTFGVSSYKARKPVIGANNGGNNFSLAAKFKNTLAENRNLLNC